MRLATHSNQAIDVQHPILSATLPDGECGAMRFEILKGVVV
ncbi:hypothetical protein LJR238_003149 [Pararhizobium sp. LjRoot238]